MKQIFTIVILFWSYAAFGQLPTVVTAPLLEAQAGATNTTLVGMNGVMGAIQAAGDQYKQLLEKAGWLKDLNTARRIVSLMENLTCTAKDLNVRLALADQSCYYQFSYDISIAKIQMAADYLGIVLATGVSFTAAERMKTLNDVIVAFEEANAAMMRLNMQLDRSITQRMSVNRVKASVVAVTNKRFSYR